MAVMTFDQFQETFNRIIFEKSKADLLGKIASSPSRYIGLFRPTKAKRKNTSKFIAVSRNPIW